MIGANAGHPLEIRIGGGHKLHIVATDGNPIKTIIADSLIVNGGERFDFYIQTKTRLAGASQQQQQLGNYFIVVRTLETKDDDFNELSVENFGLAVLKYSGTQGQEAATCGDACQPCHHSSCLKLNCPFWSKPNEGAYRCVPVSEMRSRSIPDADLELLAPNYTPDQFEEHFFNFHFAGSPSLRSSINGKRFVMPSIPPYLRHDHNSVLTACSPRCSNGLESCECSHKLKIGTNKVIQFVMYNMG